MINAEEIRANPRQNCTLLVRVSPSVAKVCIGSLILIHGRDAVSTLVLFGPQIGSRSRQWLKPKL